MERMIAAGFSAKIHTKNMTMLLKELTSEMIDAYKLARKSIPL